MKPVQALVTLAALAVCGTASAQAITLSPAVVPLGGHTGQSTSQHLTLTNSTTEPMGFSLVAKDVVVREGTRAFVDAGELADSIAATAVFSVPNVVVPPGEHRTVDVRLTLPAHVRHRAVVILFQGTTKVQQRAIVSIGSLLTFDIGGAQSVVPGTLAAQPPSESANAAFSIPIANDGTEPSIVRGAAAIVGANGALVGRIALEQRRLLPGEHAALSADYSGELASGTYRVIATVEGAKHSWTRTAELVVP